MAVAAAFLLTLSGCGSDNNSNEPSAADHYVGKRVDHYVGKRVDHHCVGKRADQHTVSRARARDRQLRNRRAS